MDLINSNANKLHVSHAATSSYLKVNCPPWLFSMDLFGTIDFEASKSVIKKQKLQLHLTKVILFASVDVAHACF